MNKKKKIITLGSLFLLILSFTLLIVTLVLNNYAKTDT
jgi:hypothetical protein